MIGFNPKSKGIFGGFILIEMDGDARPNILSEIRETCNRVVDLSREHVVVDDGAINDWVERFPSENVEEIRKGNSLVQFCQIL